MVTPAMSEIAAVPHLPSLLIDAHVHFHPGFRRDELLDAAVASFARGAAELEIEGPTIGCLMLAETAEERWFLRLSRQEEGARFGAWQFEPGGDDAVLTARRQADGATLLIVAGRQVRSREGLEVLALATREEFPDGLPFSDALTRVRWSGAVTVIPWGFGKWWLYRGALVEAALRRVTGPGIFLGDNAGRPQSVDRPRLFREAEVRGIPVLPGSDPLPLPEHALRAGSYGFVLEGGLDVGQPVQSLKQALLSLTPAPRTFGRRVSLAGCCRDQVALRLRSWRPAPVGPAAVPRTERAAAPSSWTR
ncbi:MAG: hypothetical protein QOF89_3900 [Acidobacteriota bacterium]|jgi:hypothetical protein|nr:hypothetical protein [Acidobacteriota bacterium]